MQENINMGNEFIERLKNMQNMVNEKKANENNKETLDVKKENDEQLKGDMQSQMGEELKNLLIGKLEKEIVGYVSPEKENTSQEISNETSDISNILDSNPITSEEMQNIMQLQDPATLLTQLAEIIIKEIVSKIVENANKFFDRDKKEQDNTITNDSEITSKDNIEIKDMPYMDAIFDPERANEVKDGKFEIGDELPQIDEIYKDMPYMDATFDPERAKEAKEGKAELVDGLPKIDEIFDKEKANDEKETKDNNKIFDMDKIFENIPNIHEIVEKIPNLDKIIENMPFMDEIFNKENTEKENESKENEFSDRINDEILEKINELQEFPTKDAEEFKKRIEELKNWVKNKDVMVKGNITEKDSETAINAFKEGTIEGKQNLNVQEQNQMDDRTK